MERDKNDKKRKFLARIRLLMYLDVLLVVFRIGTLDFYNLAFVSNYGKYALILLLVAVYLWLNQEEKRISRYLRKHRE